MPKKSRKRNDKNTQTTDRKSAKSTRRNAPGKARKGLIPWYEAPRAKWRGTRIVFGHWSALGLLVRDDLVAVDTGCVWGRHLTAVRLDGDPLVTDVRCRD